MKKEKIAIIGMSGLFPGSETIEQFWENLVQNKDLVTSSTEKDFGVSPEIFYNEEKGKLDHCYALRGGYVRDFSFDPKGYLLDADVLSKQGDQFQWSLYVVREALKDSGYWNSKALKNAGVIVGNLSFPSRHSRQLLSALYAEMCEEVISELTDKQVKVKASKTNYSADLKDTLLTNAPSALIAQAVGLRGLHYSIDAACASSLYAIKLACDELLLGKADMMLAGAVSGSDALFIHMGFSYFHAYARENEPSVPMHQNSGGLISSEGAGMVVLKRLSDAQRDGDKIHAVIDAVGLSNDGAGQFLLSPNPKGQRLAFERAHEQCDKDPGEIQYLECHATGTPLGDKTELNSISEFFIGKDGKKPIIGSAKSNMGHLLTSAGMVGLLKVVLGMKNNLIPATIMVDEPISSKNGIIGSDQIVTQNMEWPKNNGADHCAGINTFGFGGTNAHLILSSYNEKEKPKMTKPAVSTNQSLAIVGMGLHFGDCSDLEMFYASLFNGVQHFRPLSENRWKGLDELKSLQTAYGLPPREKLNGAWLDEFELDIMRYKIQPKEAERLTLQQTLMLKVASAAMDDAGLNEISGNGNNIAVITAMESELEIHHRMGRWDMSWQINEALEEAGIELDKARESKLSNLLKNAIFLAHEDHSPSEHTGFIGNIMSSRISSLMDFTGPSFTVSSNENAVFKAMEIARNLLMMGEVEAVVLGAIDLTGSLESVISRQALHPMNDGKASMGWNWSTNGWIPGEGAGAIVLKRSGDTDSGKVYAHIDDLAIMQSEHTSLRGETGKDAVFNVANTVLTRQNLKPSDIGFLELSASGIAHEDEAEINGLTKAYRLKNTELTCALGSSKAHVGHTFSASGMASIIKASLSLYYRFLSGVPNWEGPEQAEPFKKTPFYVPEHSRPWISEKGQSKLRAAISGIGSDGTAAHMILSEGNHPTADEKSPYLLKGGARLFPIGGKSADELVKGLESLNTKAEEGTLEYIADETCRTFDSLPNKEKYVIGIVAANTVKLKLEIKFFLKELAGSMDSTKPLQTPTGSYFTPNPLSSKGKVMLVYPGSGSAYVGMGAGMFQAFPPLYDFIKGRVNDISNAFFSAELYPRSLFKLTDEEKKERELRLQTNALPMMAAGCTFSAVYTSVLQDYLGVQADSVMGCSMGETSAMWYSQGIWDAHQADKKFLEAPLFREHVGGEMKLLAKQWGLSPKEARESWISSLIKLPEGIDGYTSLADWYYKEVEKKEDRVFLTFIHTDTEIILSGHNKDIARVLNKANLSAVSMKINNVVHHEFCRDLMDQLLEMHDLKLEVKPDKAYYSGLTGTPLKLDRKSLAKNAAEVCCEKVDWPFLLNKVVEDEHNIFIELGPNSTCSRWINELLADKDHLAVPSDRKGATALRTLNNMAAVLLSHGVQLKLSTLYDDSVIKTEKKRTLLKKLRTGGPRYKELLLTQENREYFSRRTVKQQMSLEPAIATQNKSITSTMVNKTQELDTVIKTDVPSETGKGNQIGENGLALQDYTSPDHLSGKTLIWNEKDLLTFAEGKIADVFGKDFSIIDTYKRRVMLPMPPYLLVSRVTKLQATTGVYEPSKVTTEYDIPYNSFYATDGQVPWAVGVESGQCDLLLISYLGIDFQNKGEYVYRLLDCTLTFLDDLPFEGQTLRYDISINSFVRNGNNLLFFFSYECFVEDRMVLKMDGGCAGFFSDEELEQGQGVIYTPQELEEQKNRQKQYFAPLLECDKTSFNKEDLLALVNGDLVSCFGDAYHPDGKNKSLRLPPESILMLDRITKVNRQGGSAGLGFIEAELDLHPDDWYFPCHFRDDEVLAGSLQAEGGGQLLRFFMLLLGMQRLSKDARFQPVLDIPQKVRCRKEIPAKEGKLIYRMDVKEIGLTPEPYVVSDLEILYNGFVAVCFENLGLRLQEKDDPTYLKRPENTEHGIYVKPVSPIPLLNEYHITQFALGPVHKCFGDEYKIFEGRELSRQPNTDLQFISRVLEVKGERHVFNNKPEIVAEYDVPADAWYYKQNAAPIMPYSVLMEIALQPCGFLGAYLGSTLQVPGTDLFFRNLDGDGELINDVDLRGKTITNRCVLDSHTNLAGTVLQRYGFQLFVDGELFYKGSSSFGFFTKADLSSQAGLDKGEHLTPWINNEGKDAEGKLTFKLDSLFGKMKLFKSTNPASPQLHLAGDQLNLLNEASVLKNGGKYGKGYVFATKAVRPWEWFFTCHFYQDPVMPGSLGIEAIFQAIQLFALQQGYGAALKQATFKQAAPNKTIWKYRGQILRKDPEMNLEVHIREVKDKNSSITIIADASLWKGTLRIYEVTDMAIIIS